MDVEVFYNLENLRRVVEAMRHFDPEVVITHAPVDYMLDHEDASRLGDARDDPGRATAPSPPSAADAPARDW
jgi:LmbE family N-acetylglucosaminyl deacetylase